MKTVDIIPSKSDAHRAIICQALSKNKGEVVCKFSSEDIEATKLCMTSLKKGESIMECGESGSTLRFLLPVMGALGHKAEFMPKGRLPQRPLSPLYEELEKGGCRLSPQGSVPFVIEGQLNPGIYEIAGNVSSQYITGLLLALPLIKGDSKIVVKGNLESKGYVDLTIEVMSKFGIKIEIKEYDNEDITLEYIVKGNQTYKAPPQYIVEGDWSGAAFWFAAGAFMKDELCLNGIAADSKQGDKEIVKLFQAFGGNVFQMKNQVTINEGIAKLSGINIDASQIPDMVPTLALIGAVAEGTTIIRNAGRLRIKESDRLASIATVLNGLGADVIETNDGLVINGKKGLLGGLVDSAGDHRIAMMAAIASMVCENKVILTGSQAVKKSYPNFFDEMKKLGIDSNLERK